MAKKTVYLIRHGETAYNRSWKHQYPAVPLSTRGHHQAEVVAKAVAMLPVDALVASDVARARQTAEAISGAIKKEIVFESLFRELSRPSNLAGKHFLGPLSLYVFSQLYLRSSNLSWRYQDEENFAEFRDRTHKALEYLEQYDAEHMVVVSHRIFIGGLLATLGCRFACSMSKFVQETLRLGNIPNASITELSYDSEREYPWQIVRIADVRHLR